jgi:radical SAM protein with 4Fe4S-binding SPASM domain
MQSGCVAVGVKMAVKRGANASNSLGYGIEELKFLRSFADVRRLGAKVAYKWRTREGREALGRVGPVPPSMQIEPTNLCNLRCITCPGARSATPRGYMDMDLFEKIISEAAQIGVKRIHLYLRGEPTLHPKILEMIASIKAKGLAVHLVTNGTRLTPEFAAGLLAAGVNNADQLTVSILGHSKASHEATMVGIDHDAVVRNITGLMNLRKELRVNGPVVEVLFNAPPQNQHESDDFLDFWHGKVDHARLGSYSIEFQEYKRDAVKSVVRTEPCNAVIERMTVFWNGLVAQCNGDVDGDFAIGDLNADPITDVWNCERLRKVREAHRTGQLDEFPGCLHCDL